jgi:hypothetical protein
MIRGIEFDGLCKIFDRFIKVTLLESQITLLLQFGCLQIADSTKKVVSTKDC